MSMGVRRKSLKRAPVRLKRISSLTNHLCKGPFAWQSSVQLQRDVMEEAKFTLHSTTSEFFTRQDLKDLLGWKLGNDFFEITCGCTSTLGFGDFVGSLRITQQGDISVVCNCFPGACKKGPMAPIIFQKHARNNHKSWKDSIWVTQIFQTSKYSIKVPLCNTVLLRYYYANRKVHHFNFQ